MSAWANTNKAKVMFKGRAVLTFCFLPLICQLEIHAWFDV
jgi:hypothetical protein